MRIEKASCFGGSALGRSYLAMTSRTLTASTRTGIRPIWSLPASKEMTTLQGNETNGVRIKDVVLGGCAGGFMTGLSVRAPRDGGSASKLGFQESRRSLSCHRGAALWVGRDACFRCADRVERLRPLVRMRPEFNACSHRSSNFRSRIW